MIREQITLLRVNQIAGITSDFKMDIINNFIHGTLCLHQASYIQPSTGRGVSLVH